MTFFEISATPNNVIQFPVRLLPVPEEALDQPFVAPDVDAAREMLTPRSRLGPLFGLTQRDIDRAAERVRRNVTGSAPFLVRQLPMPGVEGRSFVAPRLVFKRFFDIFIAAAALVVVAPVLAVIAILVKLDSPGPALFRQTRVGRDGREFTMYKFRSMSTTPISPESALGEFFRLRRDPRITRIGLVLRKYSLDELPQLWNVFRGDMSLVGPRPPLVREAEEYDDRERRRLFIKPGLTGLWQISERTDLSWEEAIRLDLYYVENWSLTGDLAILLRTVRIALNPVGLY